MSVWLYVNGVRICSAPRLMADQIANHMRKCGYTDVQIKPKL